MSQMQTRGYKTRLGYFYAMDSAKNDYYFKQCEMTVLILQFSAILTEILMVLKIHVNAK